MKLVYEVPEGASVALIDGSATYAMVCAHPDRKPWFVTHDGREVEIEIEVDWHAVITGEARR